MVLLELGVKENDALLYQTGYTRSELQCLLSRENRPYLGASKVEPSNATFKRKHQFYLSRYTKGSTRGRRPGCATCKKPLQDGLVIEMDAKYRFKNNTFDTTFKLHVNDECLSTAPRYSDITRIPKSINGCQASVEDIHVARHLTSFSIV